MSRVSKLAAVISGVIMLSVSAVVFATPTGLNNIPTADVVPQNVLVLQGFSRFGAERKPSWFAGVKYGPAQNLEVGIDDTVGGLGASAGLVFQAKYRLPLAEATAVALGAANLSGDTDRNGETFPYLAASHHFSTFNGHLGYSWQRNNRAWFVGGDKAVGPRLTLRADWIQANDGRDSIASLGFISPVSPRWLVESWASFPTAAGAERDYIVKLDYVVPLD